MREAGGSNPPLSTMEKVRIKNRKDQTIVVGLDILSNSKGIAFIAHGLSGFKEQTHILAIAEAFWESNYSTIRWDSTNTLGESDGRMEDATVTSSFEDLEDVIGWASNQEWFNEPFILTGHSLGGMCSGLFAEKYPNRVKALAPISTTVSGKLWKEIKDPKELKEWEERGYEERVSNSRPGIIRRVGWNLMKDGMKYDLLVNSNFLTMPLLMVVGSKDTSTPYIQQKILFDAAAATRKEIHVIENSPHTFREPAHIAELKNYFLAWLKKIE